MKKAVLMFITALAAVVLCSFSASAQTSLSAPAKIWYKLVDHSRVSLKWDSVKGADGYVLYRLDRESKEFSRIKELKKSNSALKGLTPDTEYTYAVTAYKRSEGRLIESKMRKITFTTPEKWYYSLGNDDNNSSGSLFRCRYDGSGSEKFDYSSLLPKDESCYNIILVKQYGGYVYLYLECADVLDDTMIDVYRFRNDGKEIEATRIGGHIPDKSLVIDSDTLFWGFDSRSAGDEELYITDANVMKTIVDKDGCLSAVTMFKGKSSNLSGFINDDRYVYFFTTPYIKHKYDSYDYDEYEQPEQKARLYRTAVDEPKELSYTQYGIPEDPGQEDVTELLCETELDYENSLVYIAGLRNDQLYYIIREGEGTREKTTYSFYRVNVAQSGKAPEKLMTKSFKKLAGVCVSGGYMYILADGIGYRANLNEKKFSAKEFFRINTEGFGWGFDVLNASQLEISNGYIYIKGPRSSTYYRIKLAGAVLKESKKPYVWR